MVTIHVIDRDPAVRLAARRALEPAGFVVSEAADMGPIPSRPDLVVADVSAIGLAAIKQRCPSACVLAINQNGLATPFTASELLAAVRRRLARPILA